MSGITRSASQCRPLTNNNETHLLTDRRSAQQPCTLLNVTKSHPSKILDAGYNILRLELRGH